MGSGGGGGTASPAPSYQLANQPWADYSAVTGINSLSPTAQPANVDIFNQAFSSLGAIPGGGTSSTGYSAAAPVQAGENILQSAAGMPNIAQNVWDLGQFLPAMAGQIYQTGMDPQNQLFRSVQQNVIDQSNAVNASHGLADTPYGAGIEGSNLGNFDIAWQNNLLNRQTQAATAVDQIMQQYNTDATTASQILKDYGQMNQAGIGLEQLGPATQLSTAEGLQGLEGTVLAQQQQQISDWLAYLAQGNQNQQSSVSTAAEINQANQAAQQQSQSMIGQAGSLMGGMLGK